MDSHASPPDTRAKEAIQKAQAMVREFNRKALIDASLLGSTCCGILCFFQISPKNINNELFSLNANFGISMSAFCLSALAIIYAVPSGETLTRFRQTSGYYLIVFCFKYTICTCLLNFISSYFLRIISLCETNKISILLSGLSLGIAVYGLIWVYRSVKSIFLMIMTVK